MAERAIGIASAGRSAQIQTSLDRAGVTLTSIKDRTTLRAQEEPIMDWVEPL